MRNIGRVVNLREGLAEIALGRHAACESCGACLASLDPKQRTLLAANDRGAGIGDTVEIEVPPVRAVGAAFLLFIAPLSLGLAGAYLGYRVALGLGWPGAAVAIGLIWVILRHRRQGRWGRRGCPDAAWWETFRNRLRRRRSPRARSRPVCEAGWTGNQGSCA